MCPRATGALLLSYPTDLLRIFWPIFFVVTARQDPFLKSRNFKKTVLTATKAVTNTIASSVATSRVSSSSVEEARPPWEASGVSAGDQQVSERVWWFVCVQITREERRGSLVHPRPFKLVTLLHATCACFIPQQHSVWRELAPSETCSCAPELVPLEKYDVFTTVGTNILWAFRQRL